MKHRLRPILITLSILLFSFVVPGCAKSQQNFHSFVEQLFIEEIEANPMDINYTLANPSAYGLEDLEPSISEFTEEAFNKDMKRCEEIIKTLKTFNYNTLSEEDQLTYDIIYHYYETALLAKDFYSYMEVISPTLGIQAQLPIFFAEYRFDTEDDVKDYLNLLEQTPRFFDQMIDFEQMKSEKGLFMPTSSADAVIDQAHLFIETPNENFLLSIFEEKLHAMGALSDQEKQTYIAQNENLVLNQIIPAYAKLINTIETLKPTSVNDKGLYYLEDGKSYYNYLYTSYTGSSKTIEETIEAIDDRIYSNFGLMIALTQNNEHLTETYLTLNYGFDSPEDTIEFLESAMLESFSSIGTQSLAIKYVHPSLEENLSPAFYLIPLIDESSDQVIYINQNEHYDLAAQLYPTLAHEGFPGHLYQNVFFREQDVPEIRQYLDFSGYSEGWATYVENEAINFLNIDENLKKIIKLDRTTNLLIQARIDLGVHYEGWTVEATQDYLNQYMLGADAQLVFDYVLQEPANVLKYAVGYLEFVTLREKAEKATTDLELKAFHDFLLEIGPSPFGVIDKSLDQWLENPVAFSHMNHALAI